MQNTDSKLKTAVQDSHDCRHNIQIGFSTNSYESQTHNVERLAIPLCNKFVMFGNDPTN